MKYSTSFVVAILAIVACHARNRQSTLTERALAFVGAADLSACWARFFSPRGRHGRVMWWNAKRRLV
jgi:hypothetical protein